MLKHHTDFNESLDVRKNDHTKKAGPYLVGPQICESPVKSVTQCLARRDKTDDFKTIKILTMKDASEQETNDDIQGKQLLLAEYSLLKRLDGQKGVVQQHGIFKDVAEQTLEINGKQYNSGRTFSRLCLVLDCYVPHDYCSRYNNLIDLQMYVAKEKRLPESVAIKIFYNIVEIVERLHRQNVVHRDLKLGNIILNKDTFEVTIVNFCLGKLLKTETEQLTEQRGSPAYISPDVISGKPYYGKPSDMWALGVVLYGMLYGQLPFNEAVPAALFRKIKCVDYKIPEDHKVSVKSMNIIKSLLISDVNARLTAAQVLDNVREIIQLQQNMLFETDLQVVPDFPAIEDRKRCYRGSNALTKPNPAEIEAFLAGSATSHVLEENDDDQDVKEPLAKVSKSSLLGFGLLNNSECTRKKQSKIFELQIRESMKSEFHEGIPTVTQTATLSESKKIVSVSEQQYDAILKYLSGSKQSDVPDVKPLVPELTEEAISGSITSISTIGSNSLPQPQPTQPAPALVPTAERNESDFFKSISALSADDVNIASACISAKHDDYTSPTENRLPVRIAVRKGSRGCRKNIPESVSWTVRYTRDKGLVKAKAVPIQITRV